MRDFGDKTYCFTYWPNRYATQGQMVRASWSEWVAELTKQKENSRSKSSLPGLVLGKMVEGERRRNVNVITVEALALDIERDENCFPERDTYSDRLHHVLERISKQKPLEFVAYTTYSHTSQDPRLRLIFPLVKAIRPDRYAAGMSYLNGLAGWTADINAQKLSQPVYLPAHPPGAEEAWAIHHPGAFLDLDNPLVHEVIELRDSLGVARGRAPFDASTRQACRLVLQGRPYADPGNRDETATRICWHLARRHRDVSMEAVAETFYWSCWSMDEDAPDPENLHSKITRGAEKRQLEAASTSRLQHLPGEQPHIIQHRSNYYFLMPNGAGYSRAMSKEEAHFAASKYLANVDEIELFYTNESGNIKQKSLNHLVSNYGDLAEDVAIDLTTPVSYFKDNVLHEASVRWPTMLDARFDPQINKWLELLGGEKLKDWLSILADLNRLSSALVIMGPRNIGKTLLAMGCAARFGSQAPAKQHSLTGRFQEELARCPLIYIDEDVDDNPYDRNFLASIRSELSIKERSVNRKYIAPVQMLGAIRCIISANHLPFKQKDAQTGQDLAAIAERFYWVNASSEAALYLRGVAPEDLQQWREELIARHIIHLEETRAISRENRFGVSGDSEALADLINIGVKLNSWVTEWICNGAMDGFSKLETGDRDTEKGAILFDGNVYVRVKTIVKAWERYLPNNRTAPDTRPISDALRGIADPDGPYKPHEIGIVGNNQHRYYRIRRSPLITFLEQTGTGTADELDEALRRGNVRMGA